MLWNELRRRRVGNKSPGMLIGPRLLLLPNRFWCPSLLFFHFLNGQNRNKIKEKMSNTVEALPLVVVVTRQLKIEQNNSKLLARWCRQCPKPWIESTGMFIARLVVSSLCPSFFLHSSLQTTTIQSLPLMTPKPKLATCFFWWNKAGGGQTVIHLGQSTKTRCEQQQQQHFFSLLFFVRLVILIR
jgi:hypothetical protein